MDIGFTEGNWVLEQKEQFPDYQIVFYKFVHKKLGTVHYHLDTSDTNNCFSITFRTLPNDSTGKMHILEHLALCGSKAYPVRDPFMNMIRRSLNTFMNAFTGPDFTSYPFSSTNIQDFYNLLSVYGESVFFPLLRKTDFQQEGWRLEYSNPEDSKSGLEIKGVVYNEMKGVYENPDNLFMESVQSNLLRGTPYEHDAGGRPPVIPSLTHEDLLEYHRRNYHPSNGTVFTYGDLSPLAHQKFLEEHFLSRFQRIPRPTELANLQPVTGEKRVALKMPPPAVEIKKGWDAMFGVSFACHSLGSNIHESFGLQILSSLLFDSPKSPFYIDFLEAGLADEFAPGNGYEQSIMPSFFTIGFKNIERGSQQVLEEKIFTTLKRVREEEIDPGLIEAAIHQIELTSKVVKNNFGLQMLMSYLGAINHQKEDVIKQGLNKLLSK